MQENKEHLYGLYDAIAHGEIRRNSILPQCIMLIGLTRVGKSTVFNWINNKPLVGRENEYGVVNYYLVNEKDNQAAEVSDLQTSKTLIPNVYNVDNVTRIDTAGFKDKRNHVGVFSVNCMLNFIFQKGQKYSFILVVCSDQLGQTGQPLLDTLFHFINLFDYENLDNETQKRLNSSVSLVVTKSRLNAGESDKIKKMLKGIIVNCSKPAHRSPKKQSCLKLLTDILESQRIQLFKQAQNNKNSSKCQILTTFTGRGWKSFDLLEAKVKYPNILLNSFENQFNGLEEDDKNQYMGIIRDRTQSYNIVARIFADIVSITIIQITQPIIDYTQIFSRMNQFINKFDQYTEINKDMKTRLQFVGMLFKRQGINQLLKEEPIKTMVKIKALVQFITTIDSLSHIDDDFIKVMKILRQVCVKIFSIIQDLCCRTTAEQNTLINFAYIVLRGLEEFVAITKVDSLRCKSAHRNIYDYLLSTADRTIKQQKQNIILNISKLEQQKKLAAFPKLNELAQYIVFFQQFIQEYSYQIDQQVIDSLKRKKIQDKLCYCQLLVEEGIDGYPQALRSSIKILQDIIEYRQKFLKTTNDSLQELSSNEQAIELQNYFLNCSKIIGSILLKKQKYALAINIFGSIEDCSSVLECYELQIQNLSKATHNSRGRDSDQLQESYGNYSDYCSNHGRVEKAIELMQNYQRLVTNSTKIKKIKQKLVGFVRGRQANYGKYQLLLMKQNGLFTIPEDNLRALIEQISKVSATELPVANPTDKN